MNDLLADIRRRLLECASEVRRLCIRTDSHSTVPDRIIKLVQRLVELESQMPLLMGTHDLAVALYAAENDRPLAEAEADFARWSEAPHDGDCTGLAHTCPACLVANTIDEAVALQRVLTELPHFRHGETP